MNIIQTLYHKFTFPSWKVNWNIYIQSGHWQKQLFTTKNGHWNHRA